MTTYITSEMKLTALAANLLALHDLVRDAATRTAEASDLIQHGECNGAIGVLVGLGAVLDAAKALHGAALVLHRLKTAPATSLPVGTRALTAADLRYMRGLVEVERSHLRDSQHLPGAMPEGIMDRLLAWRLTPTTPDRANEKDCAHRLIDTINSTGGLVAFANGTYAPQGDPDRLDLGDTYLAACREKAVDPVVTPHIGPEQDELPL
jgi:hypothetical protein